MRAIASLLLFLSFTLYSLFMKKDFWAQSTNRQAGFVALPILALILLGTVVAGGGGYTVYKVNQMEQRNAEMVADLQAKLELVATTTQETVMETATSTEIEIATTIEDVATSTDVSTEPEPQAKPAQVYKPTPAPVTVPVVYTPTVVDVCSNIAGIQSVIPEGYKLSGTSCVQREDKCFNIEGIQDEVPSGMLVFKGYGCMTEREMEKIEEAEREANSAVREAERLAEECADLKKSVYDMDQQMLDIEAEYVEKKKTTSSGGQGYYQATSQINALNQQMYAEIGIIELERNKLANEYNYKCI